MSSAKLSNARKRRNRSTPPQPPAAQPSFVYNALEEQASPAIRRACCGNIETVTFDDLANHPQLHYLADNEAIHTGYRQSMSCKRAFTSLFAWHNETVNVWSHGVGAVTFLCIGIFMLLGGMQPSPHRAHDHISTLNREQAVQLHGRTGTMPAVWQCAVDYSLDMPYCPVGFTGSCSSSLPWSQPLLVRGRHTLDMFMHAIRSSAPQLRSSMACWVEFRGGRLAALDYPRKGELGLENLDLPSFALQDSSTLTGASDALSSAYSRLTVRASELEAEMAEKAMNHIRPLMQGVETAANQMFGRQPVLKRVTEGLYQRVRAAYKLLSELPEELQAELTPFVQATQRYAEQFSDRVRMRIMADVHEWNPALESELAIDDGRAVTVDEALEDAWFKQHAVEESEAYHRHAGHVPQWPILIFVASAVALLTASATFHLMHIVDKVWFDLLARLDYAAISVLIWGSSVPVFYYGFYCMPKTFLVYEVLSFLTCAACLIVGLSDKFRAREWRMVRMSVFIATGAYGALPFSHMFLTSQQQHTEALYGLGLMGFLYLSGALLYGFRVPERFFPGRFDLVFASHQIFHVCVFAACIVHYITVVSHYHWRVHHAVCDSV